MTWPIAGQACGVTYWLLVFVTLVASSSPALASTPDSRLLIPVVDLREITSRFGQRHDGFHSGIDLAAPYGSPVVAAEDGIVVSERRDPEYGIMVDLRGRSGALTRYAHLASVATAIHSGSAIGRGMLLGAVGETGRATGPHLHFEVRIGEDPVDPAPYMVASRRWVQRFAAPTVQATSRRHGRSGAPHHR